MATEIEINAVVDAVITAFDSDPALWTAFLERSKLETEVAKVESQIRVLKATDTVQQTDIANQISALQSQLLDLRSQIDALE